MIRPRRSLGWLFIVVGGLLVIDGALTVVWQEPFSALYGRKQQQKLDAELRRELERFAPSEAELKALAGLHSQRARYRVLIESLKRKAREGHPVGRVEIARIGVDFAFVEGTEPKSLRKGPGHYRVTAWPGERGTVAVAGHRTTYLAPFRYINKLQDGDRIVLKMPYGQFTYAVDRVQVVKPSQLGVIAQARFDRVVLTACHPLYSVKKRIVVSARLIGSVPSASLANAVQETVKR